ncbi:septum formation protein Maf [Paenibacillus sp. 1011MAR3C5]|uniref:Maf family protein n=1 Tax=Paenibacillus sp. 1011MAR3C5 TaxID=1675787 RepID=UPI000E6B6AD5|nr:Maf family protein [Paenibacillus sp. 1011MAR3C5]RJE91047.1 septum formation protein Maf [Paenibacillus sp. 1011MAR3C5]
MTTNQNVIEPISRIVLASSSPRRKELVASLDLSLPVYILSTDADETVLDHWTPQATVEELSLRKATAALAMLREREHKTVGTSDLVIAADTIVALDGDILGKPRNDDEAASMLGRLSGRQHDVFTGIVCIAADSGKTLVASRRTKVKMKELDTLRISRYVATGEPRDKAGSYGIQGLGSTFVEEIEGCYFNVVGLPLSLLSDMLEQYGIRVV